MALQGRLLCRLEFFIYRELSVGPFFVDGEGHRHPHLKVMTTPSASQQLSNLSELLATQEAALAKVAELRALLVGLSGEEGRRVEQVVAKAPHYEAEARRVRQQMRDLDERMAKIQVAVKKLEERKRAALAEEELNEERLRAKETK